MKRQEKFEDDGRTIADMSGIMPQPQFLPRRAKRTEEPRAKGTELDLTPGEKRWAVLGVMKAVLLIAGLYLLGLGVLLGILFLIW